MKARSKHTQLQRYTRNWATHEIMKTLIKNKRSYKKRIASEDDDGDSFMKGGEELKVDSDEGRDGNEEGNENENDYNHEEEFEGNSNAGWDRGEENGDDYEGERSGDGEGNIENAEKEGTTSFEGNGEEEVRDNIDDRSAVGPSAWDLEWEGTDTAGLMFVSGSGATTSQSAAAKFLKKSAATSKSVGKFKFKPAASAVGLVAGTKRKVPEDEDHGAGADQVNVAAVTERRNPARNIREPKKLRL